VFAPVAPDGKEMHGYHRREAVHQWAFISPCTASAYALPDWGAINNVVYHPPLLRDSFHRPPMGILGCCGGIANASPWYAPIMASFVLVVPPAQPTARTSLLKTC